jgi:DNA-binding FadR family transcriptional regulator
LVRQLLSEIITEMVTLPDVKENSIRIQRQIAQAIEKSDIDEAEKRAIEHMKYIESLLDSYE